MAEHVGPDPAFDACAFCGAFDDVVEHVVAEFAAGWVAFADAVGFSFPYGAEEVFAAFWADSVPCFEVGEDCHVDGYVSAFVELGFADVDVGSGAVDVDVVGVQVEYFAFA